MSRVSWHGLKFGLSAVAISAGLKSPLCVAQSRLSLEKESSGELKTSIDEVTVKKKPIETEMGFRMRSYQSTQAEFYRPSADTDQVEWSFSAQSHPGARGGGFDFENVFQQKENANYFKPAELYYRWESSQDSQLYLGRKLMPWSKSDRIWRRGLFESRFMDQPLEGRPAGLTGFFWSSTKQKKSHWLFFASPFFVPELGPRTTVQDDKITSPNPWFRPPPDTIIMNNQELPMHYQIRSPAVEDVVLNPSVGVSYSWVPSSASTEIRVGSVFKPANQFLYEVPFVLNLGENNDAIFVEADVVPKVQYHHVSTLAVEQSLGQLASLTGDLIYEKHYLDDVNEKSITQSRTDAAIWTLTLESKAPQTDSLFYPQSWISYSRVVGGEARDQGEFASEKSIFEKRFQFQDAVQVGTKLTVVHAKAGPVILKTSALYDHAQRGGILSAEVTQFLRAGWRWSMSADWLGKLESEAPVADGFTGLYRTNDRLSLGVSYVF